MLEGLVCTVRIQALEYSYAQIAVTTHGKHTMVGSCDEVQAKPNIRIIHFASP